MFTHIPVIGVGIIIAFLLIGRIRGSHEVQWVSLQLFVALALVSIIVYLTGSPASHQMRVLPGISRDVIHLHSTAADFAFWSLEILGAACLFAIIKYREFAKIPGRLMDALLALALIVLVLMAWTANLGGRIRHPEIGAYSDIRWSGYT